MPRTNSDALPFTPMKRSPSTGWSMMPSTGRPFSSSAISEPHSWRPLMKARVPSTGSSTQRSPLVPAFSPIFLAQDSVVRPFALDDRADRALRALVGLGHRIEHRALRGALVGDVDALAEIGADHLPRRIGQAVRKGDCGGVDGHSVQRLLPGSHERANGWVGGGEHEPPADPLTLPSPSKGRGKIRYIEAAYREAAMKSVVVTGSSTGIGWGATKVLIQNGFRVFG